LDKELSHNYIRFEVLTAVTMKRALFWDTILYIPVEFHCSVGGKYCLRLQDKGVINQPESGAKYKNSCKDVGVRVYSYEQYEPSLICF
jgi:hypothetical protein